MTKKVKVSLLVLIWGIVILQSFVNYKEHKKVSSSQAVTAFSVIEDSVSMETIQGYGYFGTMEIEESTRQKMLKNLAQKLGITDGYDITMEQDEDWEKMILTKKGKYATSIFQIISLTEGDVEPEQYILMTVETKEGVEEAYGIYKKMKRIYDEIEINARVTMEVQIEKFGNYVEDDSLREDLISEIFDVIKAKQVKGIETSDLSTVYGYTHLEDAYLMVDGKKVNAQIVMSYGEEENKTYIKVGLPIVNSSY